MSLSHASKPRKVLGLLYTFAISSMQSLIVTVHAAILWDGEVIGFREAWRSLLTYIQALGRDALLFSAGDGQISVQLVWFGGRKSVLLT